jgi:hypothetical protein
MFFLAKGRLEIATGLLEWTTEYFVFEGKYASDNAIMLSDNVFRFCLMHRAAAVK